MALVLQNKQYKIVIDSNKLIGVLGKDYESFLNSLKTKNNYVLDSMFLYQGRVSDILNYEQNKDLIHFYLEELSLNFEILNKDYHALSSSEQELIKYIKMFISSMKIIVIKEPFYSLDAYYQKKITTLLQELVYKRHKTILIGSHDSNLIYSLCKKVLLIKNNEYLYGDKNDLLTNDTFLQEYGIIKPEIVHFVSLAREKGINLDYVDDIRDLMKDVYRNV